MKEWASLYNPFNSWKVLAWPAHIRGIVNDQFLPPIVVNWDLVLGCNYKCPHCIWAKRRNLPPTKVSTELIRKVPQFLYDWGVKGVCIAGESGDPSLHPDLGMALRLLHHWNIEVGYVSNGYVMNDMEAIAHYCKFAGFSMDAGDSESYAKTKGVPESNFKEVIQNISRLANYSHNLPVEIGYKVLILPSSYHTIAQGAKLARKIGVRDYHIRPAHLPDSEIQKIDIKRLEEQLEASHELETSDFHVYSVRHKFTESLQKRSQNHCWVTPLTSTWLATGEVVLCVDLRDENYNTLCNYIQDGLPEVKRLWASPKHLGLVKELNNRLSSCKRCTNGGYNDLIENVFVQDKMDLRMI